VALSSRDGAFDVERFRFAASRRVIAATTTDARRSPDAFSNPALAVVVVTGRGAPNNACGADDDVAPNGAAFESVAVEAPMLARNRDATFAVAAIHFFDALSRSSSCTMGAKGTVGDARFIPYAPPAAPRSVAAVVFGFFFSLAFSARARLSLATPVNIHSGA